MIMCSYEKVLVITNRHLCQRPFLEQLRFVAQKKPKGIVLREKDLPEDEYLELAGQVLKICEEFQIPCILHFYPEAARRLNCTRIHLPLWKLQEEENLRAFSCIGASVHSVEEAVQAQRLGATYVTAGHVFATDCKKDLKPRGLDFLKNVCEAVTIPVYGIGGITSENCCQVLEQGAAGYCMMSSAMRAK